MKIGWFTVMEWIAIISLLSTAIYGFAKAYSIFTSLVKTLKELNKTIRMLNEQSVEQDKRLSLLEANTRNIWRAIKELKSVNEGR